MISASLKGRSPFPRLTASRCRSVRAPRSVTMTLRRIVAREGRRRVGLVVHPVGQRENVRIAKRVVFKLVERELPVLQGRRDRVGN